MSIVDPVNDLTAEYVRSRFDYDHRTGVLTWRSIPANVRQQHAFNTKWSGKAAGTLDEKGYIRVKLNGRRYRAHRLGWLHFYGSWPTGLLDHADGVGDHNWIDNLRDATGSQNAANQPRQQNKKCDLKGVGLYRDGRYHARIRVEGTLKQLGRFTTAEAAHAAYVSAAKQYFGDFARTS